MWAGCARLFPGKRKPLPVKSNISCTFPEYIESNNSHTEMRYFMSNGTVKAILRSLLFSYIITGILLLILSFALYKLHLKSAQVAAAVNIIYGAACFFGGLLAGKTKGQRRFFWGFLAGLAYFLVLFAMSVVLDKGIIADTRQILTVLGICGIAGTIGGMAS